MTIRSVEAIPPRIGFPRTFRFGTVDRTQSQNVVVRVTTEDRVDGYGEACPVPAFTAETQSSIVELIEGPVRDLLVGADPLQIRPFTLTGLDIAADEAVFTAADVARIGRLRTARVINLGLSKLGGLLRAWDCETVARAAGHGLTVGSVLELGIANATGLHLAAATPDLAHPSYLMCPLKYERQICCPALRVEGARSRCRMDPAWGSRSMTRR